MAIVTENGKKIYHYDFGSNIEDFKKLAFKVYYDLKECTCHDKKCSKNMPFLTKYMVFNVTYKMYLNDNDIVYKGGSSKEHVRMMYMLQSVNSPAYIYKQLENRNIYPIYEFHSSHELDNVTHDVIKRSQNMGRNIKLVAEIEVDINDHNMPKSSAGIVLPCYQKLIIKQIPDRSSKLLLDYYRKYETNHLPPPPYFKQLPLELNKLIHWYYYYS